MVTLDREGFQRFLPSGVHLVGLGVSTLLGFVAGSAFSWAPLDRAWNIFLACFLWTLIVAVGTAVIRCVRERLHRGDWWRSIAVGCEMTFPLTTMYMLAVGLATIHLSTERLVQPNGLIVNTKPDLLVIAPIFYASSLVLAIFVGPVYMLTSPFKRK